MAIELKRGVSYGALSLTPLVDVVFLLLIFFLVATRFEQEERNMDVKLPQASRLTPTVFPGREVFVTVTSTGDCYLDGQRVTGDELADRLASLAAETPGRQRVTIRADENSRTGRLVQVIDACNRAQIADYAIATE